MNDPSGGRKASHAVWWQRRGWIGRAMHERIRLRALGGEPRQWLEVDTLHGLIVVAATSIGQHVVDARGAFGLPAGLRHLCGIQPGTPLVLAAADAQVLLVHPVTRWLPCWPP